MDAGIDDHRETPGFLRQALWGVVGLLVLWVGSFALLVLDELVLDFDVFSSLPEGVQEVLFVVYWPLIWLFNELLFV